MQIQGIFISMTLTHFQMIRSVLKFSLVVLVLVGSFYITNLIVKPGESIPENMVAETSIAIDSDLHDFRNVDYLEPVSTYFYLTNTGDKNFKISKIISSCGCTVPKWNRNEVHPGKKDSILVEFAADQKGKFYRNIHVYSNAEDSPHILYIQGTVK